jgi:UDP-N-acetylmuramoylalanine-D-glutamate ligase
MELFQSKIDSIHLINDSDIDNKQIAGLAIEIYNEYIVKGKKIPGFGHRYHDIDPRADKLMEIAVEKAYEFARENGSVLFSPAFSSFGMFSGYVERGKSFQNAVLCLKNLKNL